MESDALESVPLDHAQDGDVCPSVALRFSRIDRDITPHDRHTVKCLELIRRSHHTTVMDKSRGESVFTLVGAKWSGKHALQPNIFDVDD